MMQYQSTPDYYRDYIEHGWLKDQAAKVHKYIERWRGKNGKWYYRYKSKAQETEAKVLRTVAGKWDTTITNDIRKNKSILIPSNAKEIRDRRGYSTSRSGQTGTGVVKTTKLSSKISRKPKKNGNLTSRGYSGSQGSGESKRQRNLGTRHTRYNSQDTESKFYGARRLSSAHDELEKKIKS